MRLFLCLAAMLAAAPAGAQPLPYPWLDDPEHREALDWPEPLVERYRLADPDVLSIAVLNSHTAEPTPTGNDNFGRPIGAITPAGTLVTVTIRQRYHAPSNSDGERVDANTTNLYMKRSTDGGRTWQGGYPIPEAVAGDTMRAYRWHTTGGPRWGTATQAQEWGAHWGRALGVQGRAVYAASQEGLYASDDEGASWRRVEVGSGLARDERPLYLAPEIRTHPEAGLVLLGHFPEGKRGPTPQIAVASSADGGRTWQVQHLDTGGFELVEPSFDRLPDPDLYFVFSRRDPFDRSAAPVQAILRRHGGRWSLEQTAETDIPFDAPRRDMQDTHGVFYNPVSGRLEAAVSYRGSDPADYGMKVSLYSLSLDDALAGRAHWRFDGVLHNHRSGYGNGDAPPKRYGTGRGEGQHPAGIAADAAHAWVTFGSGPSSATWANSYSVRRTLDTDRLREVLTSEDGLVNLAQDRYAAAAPGWRTPLDRLHDGRTDGLRSTALHEASEAVVEYRFGGERQIRRLEVYGGDGGGCTRWTADYWDGNAWAGVFSSDALPWKNCDGSWMHREIPYIGSVPGEIRTDRLRLTFRTEPDRPLRLYELRLWAVPEEYRPAPTIDAEATYRLP